MSNMIQAARQQVAQLTKSRTARRKKPKYWIRIMERVKVTFWMN